ncbi:MAG TPA: alpha/beta fold hydrolase [bacterium]|nr:alpha/beta fold hydrolase [bacterium]
MIAIITTLGIILLIIIAMLFLTRYMAYKFLTVKLRPKTKTPADFQLPYESAQFESEGRLLNGWIIRNNPQMPLVILVHGWESNAQGMLPHAQYLTPAGFNLFLYDARGHGDSQPEDYMSLVRFTEDLENAYCFVRKKTEFNNHPVMLLGHSMGGATACLFTARHPEIIAVVISSAFARFDLMIRDMFKTHTMLFKLLYPVLVSHWERMLKVKMKNWHPADHLARVQCPVFVAFGGQDEMFTAKHFEALTGVATKERDEKLWLPEGHHRNLYEFELYRTSVTNFLTRYAKTNLYTLMAGEKTYASLP